MSVHTFSAASLEHVLVPIAAVSSGAALDPTGLTVSMAFLDGAPDTESPVSGDWKTASWETNTVPDPDQYLARCIVGPAGAITLAAGTWHVWVKVTGSPETPVLYAGRIRVTP